MRLAIVDLRAGAHSHALETAGPAANASAAGCTVRA